MEFRVLGPLEVLADGRPLALGAPKQRLVLAELLRARGAVSRDRLIEALWGESPPRSAVGSLQVYVHGLRKALGEERILTSGPAYRLAVDPEELDLTRFERLVERARNALTQERAADAVDEAETALGLWRGAALADLAGEQEGEAFGRELEERRIAALELRNDAWLALGRHDLVLEAIDGLVGDHPYRERLRAQQILALYRDGRQTDALAAYRAAAETWRDELGLDPTPALQELERAVLQHEPSLAGPTPRRRGGGRRVPAPVTPLVGRRLEIAAVGALLRGDARLVTLVGPGGTGKTRLALAVAEELSSELLDGAVFVDLSAVTDTALVRPTIGQALGLAPAALEEELADSTLLLVLDNLEQVLDGVDVVSILLSAAPRLRVLATSRAPLHLSGEHEYRVPPLPLPRADASADELAQNESVQLFLARARAASQEIGPGADVAELCRRLDGLPLALEIAAARTKLMPPAQIADEIASLEHVARDVPSRHTTLGATIQWSLDLLGDDERAAFARLGVFTGGWSAAAAAAVGVEPPLLSSLVDHSLVVRRRDRFTMLETVRPFAVELLEGDDVRRAHAEWFADLVDGFSTAITSGGDTTALLDEIDAELENIRTAHAWALDADAPDLALRLSAATRPYWDLRGRLREGATLVEAALASAGDRFPELRAIALSFLGTAAFRAGRLEDADRIYQEMLAMFEELGDELGVARGLSDVGTVAAARGDLAVSKDLLERSAARFRELDVPKRLAVVLLNLGHVAAQLGDYDDAIAVTLEGIELSRSVGDESNIAIMLNNLAGFALAGGNLAECHRWLGECFDLALRIGYKDVVAHALATRLDLALRDGDPREAARIGAAADALLAESGSAILGEEGEHFEALKDQARDTLGDDAYAAARAEVEGLTIDQVLAEVEARRGSPG